MSAIDPLAADDGACVMWLCETERVGLQPRVLYRFDVDTDCDRCVTLDGIYRGARPTTGGAS